MILLFAEDSRHYRFPSDPHHVASVTALPDHDTSARVGLESRPVLFRKNESLRFVFSLPGRKFRAALAVEMQFAEIPQLLQPLRSVKLGMGALEVLQPAVDDRRVLGTSRVETGNDGGDIRPVVVGVIDDLQGKLRPVVGRLDVQP